MKILFIGGNGNISWHCVQKALEDGHEVWELNRGATLKTRREIQEGVNKLTADIRNDSEAQSVLKNKEFDVVVDFICYNEQHADFDIKLFQDKTKRFVFISSAGVYQRKTKYLPFKETTPKIPKEVAYDYGIGKLAAEEVFMESWEKHGFPVTIVRPTHTYDTIVPVSVGHNCWTAPQMYLDGKPILIAGDGTNIWTLTHSNDFANALLGLLEKAETVGHDFHIASDEILTWLEIMSSLANALSIKNPKFIHIPIVDIINIDVPVSKNMAISSLGKAFAFDRMWCNLFDNSKLKSFVPGWQSKILFEDGINQTVKWMFEKNEHRRINPELHKLLDDLTTKYYDRITDF